MPYKTILVHLNDQHRVPALLAAATTIARSNGAHIVGLSVLPPTIIIAGMDGSPGTVIEDHRTSYREQMKLMSEAFETATATIPGVTREWRELDCERENPFGNAASVVVAQARSADLVIAGQDNPEWALSSHLDVAEALVMETGRPVLVMPRNGAPQRLGGRVVVAWNGRREAARAAFDALPLLQAAGAVRAVWINPDSEPGTAEEIPAADLCTSLARHGVKCEAAKRGVRGEAAGPALLAAAGDFDADMLVMGCYGHSRLRELVLGGATRHVLGHARIPVLMAH